jgi:hypothetical protein
MDGSERKAARPENEIQIINKLIADCIEDKPSAGIFADLGHEAPYHRQLIIAEYKRMGNYNPQLETARYVGMRPNEGYASNDLPPDGEWYQVYGIDLYASLGTYNAMPNLNKLVEGVNKGTLSMEDALESLLNSAIVERTNAERNSTQSDADALAKNVGCQPKHKFELLIEFEGHTTILEMCENCIINAMRGGSALEMFSEPHVVKALLGNALQTFRETKANAQKEKSH